MLEVAKARPDGYTYGFPSVTTFSTTPQVKATGYNIKDFRTVAQVSVMWLSLAVNADSPIKDFKGSLKRPRPIPANTIMQATARFPPSACS